MVEPRVLKGFRDYPPALMIPRERLMEAARQVFRSYGFAPIDTPRKRGNSALLRGCARPLASGVHAMMRIRKLPVCADLAAHAGAVMTRLV